MATNVQYSEFKSTSFAEIHEDPGYFKKENLQSQEMSFRQLDTYIRDLRQSGFDTMRLRVALWHKLAYPLIAIVMAVLAIPFALSMGRRAPSPVSQLLYRWLSPTGSLMACSGPWEM